MHQGVQSHKQNLDGDFLICGAETRRRFGSMSGGGNKFVR
jgi:hypothetical protein